MEAGGEEEDRERKKESQITRGRRRIEREKSKVKLQVEDRVLELHDVHEGISLLAVVVVVRKRERPLIHFSDPLHLVAEPYPPVLQKVVRVLENFLFLQQRDTRPRKVEVG